MQRVSYLFFLLARQVAVQKPHRHPKNSDRRKPIVHRWCFFVQNLQWFLVLLLGVGIFNVWLLFQAVSSYFSIVWLYKSSYFRFVFFFQICVGKHKLKFICCSESRQQFFWQQKEKQKMWSSERNWRQENLEQSTGWRSCQKSLQKFFFWSFCQLFSFLFLKNKREILLCSNRGQKRFWNSWIFSERRLRSSVTTGEVSEERFGIRRYLSSTGKSTTSSVKGKISRGIKFTTSRIDHPDRDFAKQFNNAGVIVWFLPREWCVD